LSQATMDNERTAAANVTRMVMDAPSDGKPDN
jgi:hypothetical protein